MGYLSKLPVIRRGGQNRQYYLICPAPLAAALEMEKGETLEPQICVKGQWEHGKTPVEMDLLSHKYSPATFHPAGEKLPNGHLCNLSLQNLNIGEQETLIHAFLRFNGNSFLAVGGRTHRFDEKQKHRAERQAGGGKLKNTTEVNVRIAQCASS